MSTSFAFSSDQSRALASLLEWAQNPRGQSLTLGGYAGTGKTTIAAHFRKEFRLGTRRGRVAFCSYTGRASQVLENTLRAHRAIFASDYCGTIHSLMYAPKTDKAGRVIGWRRAKNLDYDLIVIDEASMATSEIWEDLTSYGIPIIAIGDHGQLPPIGDGFNLMENPTLRLERIHRQAEAHPIIRVSMLAREYGKIPYGRLSATVAKIRHDHPSLPALENKLFCSASDVLVLCGRNRTRVMLNKKIRAARGMVSEEPQAGERLICLKNNYHNPTSPIYNGMVGTVASITPSEKHWYRAKIDFREDRRQFSGVISRYQFHQEHFLESVPGVKFSEIGDRFDFGYALTVHKAQGSQAQVVLLYEEQSPHWQGAMWNRWLYTAVTRAREGLYIIGRS